MGATAIRSRETVEVTVEPAEDAGFGAMVLGGAQDGRAQCRCQDQGDGDRQNHRRNNGDRELPVDDADRAAEKRHRYEHRRQHGGDADQRTGDLVHRLACGFLGRELVFLHDALDVFDHHDGVVDQQADRQHHGEHRQRVDRIAEDGEHAEGAEQHDRNGQCGNERRPKILQEDEHDDEDEHDRFEQRLDHVLDRQPDEGRGVIGVDGGHALRKGRRQSGDGGLDGLGGADGVGAGR